MNNTIKHLDNGDFEVIDTSDPPLYNPSKPHFKDMGGYWKCEELNILCNPTDHNYPYHVLGVGLTNRLDNAVKMSNE